MDDPVLRIGFQLVEERDDHAVKIAGLVDNLGSIPSEIADDLVTLHADAESVLESSMDALVDDDPEQATRLAQEAVDAVAAIDEHSRALDDALRDMEPVEAQWLGLVVDSLSRSADYGGNIAENALQKAAPRPQN